MNGRWRYLLHFDHWIIVAMTVVLTALIWILFDSISIRNPFKQEVSGNSFMDIYYTFSDRSDIDQNAEIVIADMGMEQSRQRIAQSLLQIDSLKPRAIGVDIIFQRPDPDSIENAAFVEAIGAIRSPIVMASMTTVNDDSESATIKSFFVDSISITNGIAGFQIDGNTIHGFRPLAENNDTTFVGYLCALWSFKELKNQTIPIDYDHKFLVVPIDSIKEHVDLIKNGIVLVGDASSINDVYRTPIGTLSGIEIHAYCLKTLHEMEHYPYQVSLGWNILIAVVLCYFLELMLSWVHTSLSNRRKTWTLFLREWIEGSFLTNIVLLPVIAVITLIMMNEALNYWQFFNASLIFTSLVMLIESRNIYQALVKALREKHRWPWLYKSLIQD